MGLPATRLNDMCTGHDCFPPRPVIQASTNVFINGRGANRLGDMLAVHCCMISCHEGHSVQGSPTVNVNSKPLVRVQDAIDCGSYMMTGSLDVFSG